MTVDLPVPQVPLELSPDSRNISNSELTTFLSCKRQYKYAFVDNLAPRELTRPLERGISGHEAFQRYIEGRLEGMGHDTAMVHADSIFNEFIQKGVPVDRVMEVKFLFTRYMGVKQGWPEFELLGTEQSFKLKVTDDITIPMRYDLSVREIATDRILCGDFKFTYDFWQPDDHALNGQMPKYISIMRANGINVHGGFLEEIRTRPLGKEKQRDHKNLWRRTFYYPTIKRQQNFIRQHVAGSLELMEWRALPDAERDARTVPVLNKHGACKFCNFKDLCNSELDGKDITHDKEVMYIQNDYALGYNPDSPESTTLQELL